MHCPFLLHAKKLNSFPKSLNFLCKTLVLGATNIFDSSYAVLGMAFMHPPPLEKVIAFCTAETNFVLQLHSKQNKNIDNKKKQR
jgi:hypothetical protein